MFRVFDVSRCHPPSELAVFIAPQLVPVPAGLMATKISPFQCFPVRDPSGGHNFSFLLQCDEKSLPNIYGFVGSLGQPVRH
jgi:hypothetical protein